MTREVLRISGVPNERQREFFASRTRFTAYGGARGGGKSWALRRKLIAMCLRYAGLRCLLVRRSLPELRSNHLLPFLREYGAFLQWRENDRTLLLENGSRIDFGFCACDRDALRYQGQEYDVIAIDEATQLSEFHFSVFKACLRGASAHPRRMYLTCNPGGIGHAWVKRLFVDRRFRTGEVAEDYGFIPARVFDNDALLRADPDYVRSLESLPPRLRDAWLLGRWDVFEGQFFPEFDPSVHVCRLSELPRLLRVFVAADYGLDRLAALLVGVDEDGGYWVMEERCASGLTLSEGGREIAALARRAVEHGYPFPAYAVVSPDLWNRRQDSGKSGFEIMQAVEGMPSMVAADDRRIPGWRVLREYLCAKEGQPSLRIVESCRELCECLPALLCHPDRPEDASSEPHAVTHAPEALRYALMSRCPPPEEKALTDFILPQKKAPSLFD